MHIADPAITEVVKQPGDSLSLRCEVKSANPTHGNITWYLNGQDVDQIIGEIFRQSKIGDTLVILDTSTSAHTLGVYSCLLDNGIPGAECIRQLGKLC